MIAKDAWIPVAEVARPHGVRGELRLRLFNSDSDVLLDMDEVLLRTRSGEEHEVSVDGARRANDAILLKLHSVDDRDAAAALRGAHVCVRRGDFPELDTGEFYACDVIGATVFLGDDVLGKVREFRSYPSVDALVIAAADGGKDYEIPLVSAFIARVDTTTAEVFLATLDGVERG